MSLFAADRGHRGRWLFLFCGLAGLCFFSAVPSEAADSQTIRVIEERAIPYTSFLSKAEFDERFPGRKLSGPSELEPGWYVVYEHETLRYYFGPVRLEATGRDYLEQLRGIVEEAVQERPSIRDYRLELRFEPEEQAPAESPRGEETSSADSPEGTSPENREQGAPGRPAQRQEPRKRSLWDWFKGLFGG